MVGALAGGEAPSSRARRVVGALVAVTLAAAACTGAAEAARAQRPAVPPTQTLAVLHAAQNAFARPDAAAPRIAAVSDRRPITGTRTLLPVVDHARGADGRSWLRVRLPGRPNGQTGWIRRNSTRYAVTHWHLVVRTSTRRVVVYRDARRLRTFAAVVGKPSTATPRGEFFVEESVALGAADVGAPFALALSARSEVLQEFAGGPGQIALHGMDNVGGTLGTAASHGCVRLDGPSIRWLAARVGVGVPVTITR